MTQQEILRMILASPPAWLALVEAWDDVQETYVIVYDRDAGLK